MHIFIMTFATLIFFQTGLGKSQKYVVCNIIVFSHLLLIIPEYEHLSIPVCMPTSCIAESCYQFLMHFIYFVLFLCLTQ